MTIDYEPVARFFFNFNKVADDVARRGRQLLEQSLAEVAGSTALVESTIGGLERWIAAVRDQRPDTSSSAGRERCAQARSAIAKRSGPRVVR